MSPTHPSNSSKTIAILGATGNQGGGLVRALLQKNKDNPASPPFTIHALTRDVHSASAQRLKASYPNNDALKLIPADVYNVESLRQAFEGADGMFAVTNNRIPGKLIQTEEEMRHELVAGRNIVDAAKACHISHVVMSSLPNIAEASQGRFTKVYHFDHKNQIEKWAREELYAITSLHPGYFYSNMQWPQYCRRQADGIVRFCPPVPGDTLADWVDPAYDIGNYAAEIFVQGPQKTASKIYPVTSPKVPFAQLATIFESVTSQKAVFDPITLDEWGSTVAAATGKGYEDDIRQMEWTVVAPKNKIAYGTINPDDDTSWRDLGVRASTFEEWIERTKWNWPQ
ncbi:hypothetical protein ASPWEDRAFT_172472 [Aspergillus wentii DTO 134E9]|uniref:NmrA-like domain-containing protein n=1 Tax=Aspergillus wentii DTO 134E9 TaxID=1073089 RepID=A0A1L9RL61_ASPWE|nr:uncharacterized protein ASPWEDRAFT_172472 [Aspergillus wentii DTO 134E9]OJJ35675.1 hypothetical protein ASPWEDRAFT_172472 [Aspergillus wentii DTO 134E9]